MVQSDDNSDCGTASFELTAALITVFGFQPKTKKTKMQKIVMTKKQNKRKYCYSC